ncbi:MAG: hypothetical protein JWO15_3624 [Sphingomonadales bacterium]|nr:hypothetical protein [Sphingomonadales bacterium]
MRIRELSQAKLLDAMPVDAKFICLYLRMSKKATYEAPIILSTSHNQGWYWPGIEGMFVAMGHWYI